MLFNALSNGINIGKHCDHGAEIARSSGHQVSPSGRQYMQILRAVSACRCKSYKLSIAVACKGISLYAEILQNIESSQIYSSEGRLSHPRVTEDELSLLPLFLVKRWAGIEVFHEALIQCVCFVHVK